MSDAKTVKPGEAVRYHNEPIRPVTFSPRPADPVVERLTLLVNLFARNAKVRLKWDGHVYSFKVNERGRIELASDGLHRGWFVDAEDIEVVE